MDDSRYSVLCSDYGLRHAELVAWRDNANRFVQKFCSGFTSYLGCPEYFENIEGRKLRVVSPARLTDSGELIPLSALVADGKIAVPTESAEWLFAVQIYLADHENDPFKQVFICECRFTIEGTTIRLRVAKQEDPITVDLENAASFEAAFAALYEHFRTYLSLRPANGARKQRMGFVTTDDI